MVTVRVGDENVSIYFKQDSAVGRLSKQGVESVTQVGCALVGREGRVLSVGNAFCSPKDEVNIAEGMELALGRALKKLTSNRELRTKFWAVFHRSVNLQIAQEQQRENELAAQMAGADWTQLPLPIVGPELAGQPFIDVTPVKVEPVQTGDQQRLARLQENLASYTRSHEEGYSRSSQDKCDTCQNLKKEIAQLEWLAA